MKEETKSMDHRLSSGYPPVGVLRSALKQRWIQGSLALALPTLCWPQDQTSQQTQDAAPAASLSGSIDTGLSSSFKDPDDPAYEASIDFGLSLKTTFNTNHSLSLSTTFSKNLEDEQNWVFVRDLPVGYTFSGIKLTENLSMSLGSTLWLPMTEASRDATLKAGLTAGPTVTWKAVEIGAPDLTLSYGLSGRQNFHTYQEGVGGSPSTAQSLSQRLRAIYALGDWTFTTDNIFATARTYQGAIKSSFITDLSVAYAIDDTLETSLSVGNTGNTLAADGTNSNFNVFDPQTSSWSVGVSYSF